MTFDPYKMQGALFSMNDDDDASETMFDFGFQDCDTYLATKSSQDYQTAIQQAVQDADFVKVRWFVSSSSPAAGDSVHAARRGDLPDHLYQRNSSVRWGSPIRVSPLPNPRSLPHLSFSSRETYPITGLPVRRTTSGRQAPVNAKFTTFFESLPLYVKALREQDPKSTKAAVIECKLLLATRKYVQGHQAAEKHLAVDPDVRRPCLSRRPPLTLFSLQCAYMYYILAMGNPDPYGAPVVVQNQVVWETDLRVYAKAAEEWDAVFVATGAGKEAKEEVDDDGLNELMKSLCCGEKPEGGVQEHRHLPDALDEESVAL